MTEARANFAAVLSAARGGEVQIIESAGQKDVRVAADDGAERDAERRGLPLSYVLASVAERDALDLALQQWQQAHSASPRTGERRSLADMHLPPNISGDVARWIKRERGTLALAVHVVEYAIAVRGAQERLEITQSTISAVAAGLDLTAGGGLVDAATVRGIQDIARSSWPDDGQRVVGDDWRQIARRGDVPNEAGGTPP